MGKDILISVIVSVYNVLNYLDKCINSILNQMYGNLEVILVDDGSTDGCSEMCDRYALADARIKVIHQKSKGLASARKAGVKIAKGEYIAFVEGGDWINGEMYQVLLDRALFFQADIVESSYYYRKDNAEVMMLNTEADYILDKEQIKNIIENKFRDSDNILIRSMICTGLYRINIIKESYTEVPEEIPMGEDVINYIRLFKYAKKISFISRAFYHLNYREDFLSPIVSVRNFRSLNEMLGRCTSVVENYYPYINKGILDTWYFRKVLAGFQKIHFDDDWDMPKYKCINVDDLQNRRVVIYGAGNVGKDVYRQLTKYELWSVVGWIDKNYQRYHYPYYIVKSPDYLKSVNYDIVLVAVLKESLFISIKSELIEHGVPEQKIVWSQVISLVDDISQKNVDYNIVKFTGGLGNQMFQYAFYRAMQERGIKTTVNNKGFDVDIRRFELPEIFPKIQLELDDENMFDNYRNSLSFHELYHEKQDGVYDESVFNEGDVSFLGYWQTEKYFQPIKKKIIDEFTFYIKDITLVEMAKRITQIDNAVSIHVRRGDYLDLPEMYCGICTAEYYEKAIQYIKKHVTHPQFFVFSDDLPWVRKNLTIENAVYIDESMFDVYSSWYDMYLMTCCKHNIIANSSFSWWGAWLNPNENKIVVAPKVWINGKATTDIWVDGWKRI